jgi:hypothetical protein
VTSFKILGVFVGFCSTSSQAQICAGGLKKQS